MDTKVTDAAAPGAGDAAIEGRIVGQAGGRAGERREGDGGGEHTDRFAGGPGKDGTGAGAGGGRERLQGDTNGDGRVDIDDRRLPLIARIYGILVLISGMVTVVPLVGVAVQGVLSVIKGQVDGSVFDLTFILNCLHVAVLLISSAGMVIFGSLLLRNRRKHGARWAYALIPVTIADGMLSLALTGIGWNLVSPTVQLAILVTLSIVLDPALLEERRLQYTLRRMDERSDYEKALAKGMVGRDPSGKGYIELEFFNVFWLFMIGCVFGLVVETIYHRIFWGEWQDRAGLLWGPFSPIYGCGAVILTACLNRLWRSNPLLIFCTSAVIGGAFEYFVSWFMEVAFGIVAWDYTGQWLSIDGRTSGKYMFFWGLLGVVWIKLLLPRILWLINRIPWKVRYSLTAVAFAFMVVDAAMTLMAFDCWYGRVSGDVTDSPVTRFFARHFGDEVMQERFQTMSIDPSRSGRL